MFDLGTLFAESFEPGQWSLGMLIDSLQDLSQGQPIACSSKLRSYRGFYAHLAIEPGESTVGELLSNLEAAVGSTFTGYKGGEYVMSRKTPMWLAEYGCCGPYISGVDSSSWRVHLVTTEDDDG